MPIFLRPAARNHDINHRSLLRIIKDLPAENQLHEVVSQWHAMPDQFQLWLAVFNERDVGFALLQGREISGIAVHGATRRRGVGRRLVSLLLQEHPDLSVTTDTTECVLSRLISEQK